MTNCGVLARNNHDQKWRDKQRIKPGPFIDCKAKPKHGIQPYPPFAVAQNPVTGQIYDNNLSIDPAISGAGDGGNRGEYTGKALMRLAQLWEGLPPIGQRPAK